MRNSSFAEILIDKILGPHEPESLPERDLSPAHLAFLLGTVGRCRLDKDLRSTAYRRHIKPPPPRPRHQLSGPQALAYELFCQEGANLDPGFNLRELKHAYRQLALKTHPDRGGKPECFMAIRHSFDVLLGVLKNKPL